MNEKYNEIIDKPHYVSPIRAPMTRSDRAAQFAPYSALSGYEDAVKETARRTEHRIELDEYEKEKINVTLNSLLTAPIDTRVSITFFRPDERKQGGEYVTVTGEIGKIDDTTHEITLVGGCPIKLEDIIYIEELSNEE